MNDKTVGFILKQSDYKERDLILTVLTKEYGKLSFIAPGVKKLTSKNAGSILPYTKAEIQFDYREDRTMFRMKSAHTVKLYKTIHEDLFVQTACVLISEAAEQFADEDSVRMFTLLEEAYAMLEDKKDPQLCTALVISEVLKCFGIMPQADCCSECGSTSVASISVSAGGFLCRDCASRDHAPLYERDTLRKFRILCKAGLEHFDIVAEAITVNVQDVEILKEFLQTYSGVRLRSFSFYQRVFHH